MNDEMIIEQLRKMRSFQRDKLDKELYPSYIEGLNNALEDINKEYDDILADYNNAKAEWEKDRDAVISFSGKESRLKFCKVEAILNQCSSKRSKIKEVFEATCERNIKLREFDIETERMVLAHICNVELICGSNKLLPERDEQKDDVK